jgi:hypothetical protein
MYQNLEEPLLKCLTSENLTVAIISEKSDISINILNIIKQKFIQFNLESIKIKHNRQTELILDNGCKFLAMSNNPNNYRGRSLDIVIIIEYIDKTYLYPSIVRNNTMIVQM